MTYDADTRARAEYIADLASQLADQAHEYGLTAAEFCLRMAVIETSRIAADKISQDEQIIPCHWA